MKLNAFLLTSLSTLSAILCYTNAQEKFTNNEVTLEIEGDAATVDPTFSSPTLLSTSSPLEMEEGIRTYPSTTLQQTDIYGQPIAPVTNQHQAYATRPTLIEKSHLYRRASVVYEYFGDQQIEHSAGEFNYSNLYLTVPMRNPRKNAYRGWHFRLSLNSRFTWISESHSKLIDESSLYTISLTPSLIYNIDKKAQFTLGAVPIVSTDFDHLSSSSFYLGAYAALSYRASSKLHIMLGLSYVPDYYTQDFWPLANVNWEIRPSWNLRIQAHRISLLKTFSKTRKSGTKFDFGIGPFMQSNTFLWSVKRDRQSQLMRMESFLIGVTGSVSVATRSENLMRFYADLGVNFDQDIRFISKNTGHITEKYQADPGLYLRFGMNFSF